MRFITPILAAAVAAAFSSGLLLADVRCAAGDTLSVGLSQNNYTVFNDTPAISNFLLINFVRE